MTAPGGPRARTAPPQVIKTVSPLVTFSKEMPGTFDHKHGRVGGRLKKRSLLYTLRSCGKRKSKNVTHPGAWEAEAASAGEVEQSAAQRLRAGRAHVAAWSARSDLAAISHMSPKQETLRDLTSWVSPSWGWPGSATCRRGPATCPRGRATWHRPPCRPCRPQPRRRSPRRGQRCPPPA